MVGSDRLLTKPPVDFLPVGPGNGDERIADMGAMLADPVDLVKRQRIGAMYADESFSG